MITDLIPLYQSFFGISTSRYNSTAIRGIKARGQGPLGQPYYMPVKLQISKRGQPEELRLLPNEPMVSVEGSKTIVKTKIDGAKGSFKELYSMDDYRVAIRGLCINESKEDAEYPEEQVRLIRRMTEVDMSLKVISPFLDTFGIQRLVIETFNFPDYPGFPNVQPYVLYCLSDTEFDLEKVSVGNNSQQSTFPSSTTFGETIALTADDK